MAWHLARLTVLTTKDPPIRVVFDAIVGPDDANQSLGYLDLGDYVRYVHYAAVGAPATIRLAQVQRHQVLVGARRVRIEARDCEDLIGYDAPVGGETGGVNTGCDAAIVIEGTLYSDSSIDTTSHPTDETVAGLLPGGAVAYHAAWWTYTPPSDGMLNIHTYPSAYDTILALFSGTCSALTLVDYNDNRARGARERGRGDRDPRARGRPAVHPRRGLWPRRRGPNLDHGGVAAVRPAPSPSRSTAPCWPRCSSCADRWRTGSPRRARAAARPAGATRTCNTTTLARSAASGSGSSARGSRSPTATRSALRLLYDSTAAAIVGFVPLPY